MPGLPRSPETTLVSRQRKRRRTRAGRRSTTQAAVVSWPSSVPTPPPAIRWVLPSFLCCTQYHSLAQLWRPSWIILLNPEILSLFQTSSYTFLTEHCFFLCIYLNTTVHTLQSTEKAEISLPYPFPKIEKKEFQEFTLHLKTEKACFSIFFEV